MTKRGWVRVAAMLSLLLALSACGAGESTRPGDRGAATTDTTAAVDSRYIRWRARVDGADGMLATADALYVASPEILTAFNTSTGQVLWEASMSDTSGSTPMVLRDGVLVVAAESVEAFDAATGGVATYSGPAPTEALSFRLPDGYEFTRRVLSFNGEPVWTGRSNHAPRVGRVAELTVVNDFDGGLAIVDDDARVLFRRAITGREFDESAVLVDAPRSVAYAMTADGVLWAIQPP